MSLSVVLAVGLDSWPITSEATTARSAGYVVVSAESIFEALDLFKAGDFDLVLLGPSVTGEKRERLISLIRASGSGVPVAHFGGPVADDTCCPGGTLNKEARAILANMDQLLAEESHKWSGFARRLPASRIQRAS